MIDAPIGLAFAAGLVATVNPCGFAMLPAYLSYFMGLEGAEEDHDTGAGVTQALKVGAIVSLGFLFVFGTTGLLINAGVRSIIDWIPYVALGIGAAMVLLGIAMFSGLQISIGFLKVQGGTSSRDSKSVFTFGVSYAAGFAVVHASGLFVRSRRVDSKQQLRCRFPHLYRLRPRHVGAVDGTDVGRCIRQRGACSSIAVDVEVRPKGLVGVSGCRRPLYRLVLGRQPLVRCR